jgi:hypothetical protein
MIDEIILPFVLQTGAMGLLAWLIYYDRKFYREIILELLKGRK